LSQKAAGAVSIHARLRAIRAVMRGSFEAAKRLDWPGRVADLTLIRGSDARASLKRDGHLRSRSGELSHRGSDAAASNEAAACLTDQTDTIANSFRGSDAAASLSSATPSVVSAYWDHSHPPDAEEARPH